MSSRTPIWFSPYTLKSQNSLNSKRFSQSHHGALLRIGSGFANLHPWPELGDPTLEKCLSDLANARRWPLVRRAIRCAEMDGFAREQEFSLFEELEVPLSHATLPTLDDEALTAAVAAGFDTVKLKLGRNLETEKNWIIRAHQANPQLRWRFDFNETSEADVLLEWLAHFSRELRKQIDFLEDPCPYSETTWTRLRNESGIKLAVDREAAPLSHAAQFQIIKPALDEPWLIAESAAQRGQLAVVTSYMDHPLGQAFAAWEAGRLALQFRGLVQTCGLQTHHLWEKNPFSECLGAWSPTFNSPGGLGLGFDELFDQLPWKKLS